MENPETKRPYETPAIEVIELDSTPQLLAQSPQGRNYYGDGR